MPVNPLDYFEVGQKVGKAKRSTFGRMAEGVMGDFQAEKQRKIKQGDELDIYRKKKDIDISASADAMKSMTGGELGGATPYSMTGGKLTYRFEQPQKVFQNNPMTGEVKEVGNIPRGSRIFNRRVPPQASIDAANTIDAIDEPLQGIKQILTKDPQTIYRASINPFGERTYKAYYNAIKKQIAQAVGGKTLTLNEERIIKDNLPGLFDVQDPTAIATKISLIENTLKRAKQRYMSGEIYADNGSDMGQASGSQEEQYDSLVEELIASGMGEEEAMAQADQEFGL